jgi:hypothetical protein
VIKMERRRDGEKESQGDGHAMRPVVLSPSLALSFSPTLSWPSFGRDPQASSRKPQASLTTGKAPEVA